MLKLKRVYDPVSRTDGTRFLVERLWPRGITKERLWPRGITKERLWPRGITKERLPLEAWLKEAGPSTELRKWFSHDPAKWAQFKTRYSRELDSRPESWQPILAAAKRGTVTLLYSSHDEEHNNAVALKAYLEKKLRR